MLRKPVTKNTAKRKALCYTLLGLAALTVLLLVFSGGRRFVYGVFGYAVYAYIPATVLLSLLLLSGRSPDISASRTALYISVFFMLVLTLHIGLGADLVDSGSYIPDTYAANTVGGVLMGLPAALLRLIFPNFTFMLVTSFVITAILLFAAIYPFIANLGRGKNAFKEKAPRKSAETLAPAAKNESARIEGAFAEDARRAGYTRDDSVVNVTGAGENYFGALLGEEERERKRAGRSADVLFGNADPRTSDRSPVYDYSTLRALGEENGFDTVYTNQGRARMLEESLAPKSADEEYAERYGGGKLDDNYAATRARSDDHTSQFVPKMPVEQDPYGYDESSPSRPSAYGGYDDGRSATRAPQYGGYGERSAYDTGREYRDDRDRTSTYGGNGEYGGAQSAPARPSRRADETSAARPTVPEREMTAFEKLYSNPISVLPVEEDEPQVRKPASVPATPAPVARTTQYPQYDAAATQPAAREERGSRPAMDRNAMLEYLNKPLTAEEYAGMDITRPVKGDEIYPDDAGAADYEPEPEPEVKPAPVAVKPAPAERAGGSFADVPKAPPVAEPRAPREKKPVYQSEAMRKEKAPELPVGGASGVEQSGLFPDAPKKPYVPKPYKAPGYELLRDYGNAGEDFPPDYQAVKEKIDITMQEFNVPAEVVTAKRGPTFTMYYLKLGPGYKINKVTALKENLKMRLRVKNLRIQAPIEGEDAFGIELPNAKRDTVGLKSILCTKEFNESDKGVRVALGKTFDGKPYVADLAKMPHLLVAGATGTGKSVFLNAVIVSILYKYSPEDVRMIMIDPKRVEMSVYRGLPNLLIKETVKESRHAVNVLKWLTEEMDRRYAFFEQIGCSNIDQYNDLYRDKSKEPKMQRIVLIIDEMADLMIKSKNNSVEENIVRIAQLARACGIHMIIATQRPTVQVITGLIKSNILHRVAFTVKSNTDSRVIMDDGGAEELLGMGDMLYSFPANLVRLQGAMIDIAEIKAVCDYIRANNECYFDDEIMKAITYEPPAPEPEVKVSAQEERDADFEQLLRVILKSFILSGRASVSSAQASHHVGYIKARKLVDAMAERGFLSQGDGAKPRDIMITMDQYYEIFGKDADAEGTPTINDVGGGDYDGEDDTDGDDYT